MDEISALLMTKALDGLAMRATAVSQNIANANSPAYRPLRVRFEDRLREAAAKGPEAIRAAQPEYISALPETGGGSTLRLDLEMATASQTALRYAALIDILNRQVQVTRLAVRGGQ
jgi:flagellar basal-body rod protein FlgB